MGPFTVVVEAQRECVPKTKSDVGTVENTESAVSWSLGRAPCVGSTRGRGQIRCLVGTSPRIGVQLYCLSINDTRGCCRVAACWGHLFASTLAHGMFSFSLDVVHSAVCWHPVGSVIFYFLVDPLHAVFSSFICYAPMNLAWCSFRNESRMITC